MARDPFMAELDPWVRKAENRMEAVMKGSTQEVVKRCQTPKAKGGRLPVVTSFLRNSLQSSLNGSTALTGATSYELIVQGMEIGDVAEFGWTAPYAEPVNSGARGRPGDHYLEYGVMAWQRIVANETRKAKAAVTR